MILTQAFICSLLGQGAKKVSFTTCHSSKLQLECTSPKVILTSPGDDEQG